MSNIDTNYVAVLLEEIRDEIKEVHEIVADHPTREDVHELKQDVAELKQVKG